MNYAKSVTNAKSMIYIPECPNVSIHNLLVTYVKLMIHIPLLLQLLSYIKLVAYVKPIIYISNLNIGLVNILLIK